MSYVTGATQGGGGSASITIPVNWQQYINTVDNSSDEVSFGATSNGVLVINDSAQYNIAVNFTGTAAIPSNSTSLVNNHLIRPKEAIFFNVAATEINLICENASGAQVRIFIGFDA